MRLLDVIEINQVNGGEWQNAAAAIGVALGIGNATWGSAFGTVAFASAFAGAPLAVFAIGALGLYAGWELIC